VSPQKNDARPVLLRDGNFTPPSRTPWGGRRICALKGRPHALVGESWELSLGPLFPSATEEGAPLSDRVAEDPRGWLGPAGSSALLVKLLDADDELSVQIHPKDDDPELRQGESGKPEAWYVVDRAPGAGIYLGLAEGVDAMAMAHAIDAAGDVSALLSFVPVEPGDFFSIEAGTPHCIARGVMLVEPQHVAPGCEGLTYRYWDWGRRYDAEGKLDPNGAPRALHRDRALAVTDWSLPRGDALLDRVRTRAGSVDLAAAARIEALCGSGAPIGSDRLRVARMTGTGRLDMAQADSLCALTVLEGSIRIGDIEVRKGRTAAIPASFGGFALLDRAHAIVSSAT
jgi:mannose-6-phosphate isomerase class I